MRIAFVYDVPYPWHKGGIEHILATEAQELAKEHEVHFFTLRWPGMERSFVYKGVHYHTFGEANEANTYRHGRRSIREALMFGIYSFSIFGSRFDAIITDEFPVLHLLPIRIYGLLAGCKLVIRVDEVWGREYWVSYLGGIFGGIAAFYSNLVLNSKKAFYVTNSSTTSRKLGEVGISRDRIRIFAPVLENKTLAGIVPKAQRRVIFSGRFIKEKRLDKWLGVFKKVSRSDHSVRALLVGDGPDRANIEATVRKLGLQGRVKIRGFYDNKKELYSAIANSSLFLHMSEREGLSIIALESLALGTPVVLPDYSPIPSEVRSMCIVATEGQTASRVAAILKSGDKARYIKNARNLRMFSSEGVREFYNEIL